jgi:hypothetical protein
MGRSRAAFRVGTFCVVALLAVEGCGPGGMGEADEVALARRRLMMEDVFPVPAEEMSVVPALTEPDSTAWLPVEAAGDDAAAETTEEAVVPPVVEEEEAAPPPVDEPEERAGAEEGDGEGAGEGIEPVPDDEEGDILRAE